MIVKKKYEMITTFNLSMSFCMVKEIEVMYREKFISTVPSISHLRLLLSHPRDLMLVENLQ